MMTITVHRKRGKPWVFKRRPHSTTGYYYEGRKHTYRLFMEDGEYPDIWIGLLVKDRHGEAWVTIEREIGATRVELIRGSFTFNH
jgi:hypothetical protein